MPSAKTQNPAILQVLPTLKTGGVERGTLEIAAALCQQHWISHVASSGGALITPLEENGSVHHLCPRLASKNPFYYPYNQAAIKKIITEHHINLIHARSRAPAWVCKAIAHKMHLPFVTTYHGAYSMNNSAKRYYNSVMTQGDSIIAVSHFIKKYILDHHPNTPAERINVIPRGVDPTIFNPDSIAPTAVKNLRRQWNIPDSKIILLLPARLSPWKGHFDTIKALALLPEREKYHLVFVGGGKKNLAEKIHQVAVSLNLENNISLTGNTESMPVVYALADIILCPSTRAEAFGRTVIEAQAMEKIVIATNHGGAAETIQHGFNGFHSNLNLLAESLSETIHNIQNLSADKRKHIEKQARQTVQQQYTLQHMQQATLQVYEKLLNR